MGCRRCGKKLPTVVRWPEFAGKSFRNESDETLVLINQLPIHPGDTVVLPAALINHSVRGWIQSGALVEA